MATELAVSYVSIVPSLKGFKGIVNRELSSAEGSAKASGDAMGRKMGGSFASSLKRVVGPALAVFGAGQIAGFAKSAVGAFSELEDSTAAAGVVFGDNMKQIIDQSKTAASTMGLTQQQVINAANTFGTYGKAAGLSGKDLADFATEQTKLAADMASFKGTSPEQAIEAIGAALRGETEPIRAYGVMLDDASLKAEAMAQGLITTTKDALTPQQKTLAAQALILKQTSDAQGDFARTSDSTANVQKTLSATMEDTSAKLGSVLAPAFTNAREMALGAVEGVGGLLDKVLAFQGVLSDGGTTPQLVTALGMDPKQGFGKVVGEGIGSLFAFSAAWKANDGEITSSGLPGYMEGLAYKLRGFLDTAVRVGQEVWATLGPALLELGTPVLQLVLALSPLGIILKALAPVLPQLAGAAAELAIVVGDVLTRAVEFLVPIVTAIVDGLADFFTKLTSTQAGVDGLMGVLGVATGIFLAYKVGVFATTVVTRAQTIATQAATAAQKLMNVAMKANPIGLVITLIAGLVAGLVWFFTQTETGRTIVENVWGAIRTFIGGVVTWFTTYVLPVIQKVFGAVGAIFTWLWQSIIKPVFDGIGWIINAWWQVTSALFGIGIAFIRDKLGAVFTWLWKTIIQPVFKWIGDAISWWWNNITLPVFNALVTFFRNTLGPIFTWLYNNVIKPVWDAIGSAIKWVWDTILKPVFDKIGEVVRGIPAAFEAARDGIASAWNAIMEIAKKPVIFVVDTVIGGLIDTFNKIPGVNITKPKLPGSFYAPAPSGPVQRGRTRAFAKGGFAAPGWALVGEEGPELVNFSKPGRVYTAKDTAHALGAPMPGSESHIWGPPQQAAKRAGAMRFHGLGAFPMNMLNRAAAAWNGLAGVSAQSVKHMVGGFGANSIGVRHGAMLNPNWIGYYQGQGVAIKPGGPNELATLVHEIGHALGLGHNTGNQSVMHPMLGAGGAFWPTSYDAQNLRRIYGGVGSGVTRDPGDGGTGVPDNPFSGLVDQLMGAFKKQFPGGGLFIDAAGGLAKSGIESVVKIVNDIKDGIKRIAGDVFGKITDFFGGGSGQVAELHDNGGYLQPGYSTILNKTRKPEAILNQRQWSDISKLALEGGGGRSITIQGNVGWDPAEVARRIELSERRARVVEGVLV